VSKQESRHDSVSRAVGIAGLQPAVSTATTAWESECASEIEVNCHKLISELSRDASDSDRRKCMLLAALITLIDRGIAWDDVIDVLSSPDTVLPRSAITRLPSPVQDVQIAAARFTASVDRAISTQLGLLKTGPYDIGEDGDRFAPQGTRLYLATATGELEPAYGNLGLARDAAAETDSDDPGTQVATLALSERTAISWMPARDPRFQIPPLDSDSHNPPGSMMAVRIDDLQHLPLGVLVVSSGSVRIPPDGIAEKRLLRQLSGQCEPLRILLVIRRFTKHLVGRFVSQEVSPQDRESAEQERRQRSVADAVDGPDQAALDEIPVIATALAASWRRLLTAPRDQRTALAVLHGLAERSVRLNVHPPVKMFFQRHLRLLERGQLNATQIENEAARLGLPVCDPEETVESVSGRFGYVDTVDAQQARVILLDEREQGAVADLWIPVNWLPRSYRDEGAGVAWVERRYRSGTKGRFEPSSARE